jgi:hypothetical protein
MKRLLPLLIGVLLLGACTTIPTEKEGLEFVELINAGDWEQLSAQSGTPFLLDTEMIMRAADMREFWKILAEGNFSLGETEFEIIDQEARADRYGKGLEIEQFFVKYVPEGAVTFLVTGGPGKFYMTVGKDEERTSRLYAFAGPLE